MYYWSCGRCGAACPETFSVGQPLGHQWDYGIGDITCLICGATDHICNWCGPEYIGNCETGLTEIYKCAYCGEESTTVIEPKAHNPADIASGCYTLRTPATCTEAAIYSLDCMDCGGLTDSYVSIGNALGHAYNSTTGLCSRCQAQGLKCGGCSGYYDELCVGERCDSCCNTFPCGCGEVVHTSDPDWCGCLNIYCTDCCGCREGSCGWCGKVRILEDCGYCEECCYIHCTEHI
jgi:hypothetical protein